MTCFQSLLFLVFGVLLTSLPSIKTQCQLDVIQVLAVSEPSCCSLLLHTHTPPSTQSIHHCLTDIINHGGSQTLQACNPDITDIFIQHIQGHSGVTNGSTSGVTNGSTSGVTDQKTLKAHHYERGEHAAIEIIERSLLDLKLKMNNKERIKVNGILMILCIMTILAISFLGILWLYVLFIDDVHTPFTHTPFTHTLYTPSYPPYIF
eukprot:Blabericola_migrator_1__5925@NODE_299_length_10197_cov_100_341955_g246_i0_p4_GENE_NODE_299_length_10197_cov_100_341955_g246_i0NODE_299_length_10197_cov_100_341955_g246_i0_p4_ORF_typecomplete_len206_score29_04DUF3784/PF12650_7/8_3e02DUF3784/PF12650_7/0_32_NODE_299_length_10197_cov_100_341955_g246_i078868503